MSDDNWWDKEFYKDKEKRKKAGRTTAKGGIGFIAIAFFIGYLFLHPFIPGGSQMEAGFAFAVFSGLALVFAFFGLFTGCYFIFFLKGWYETALHLAGFSTIATNWLQWIAFYPIVFIGCLINFGLILFILYKLIKWIVRKARR